MDGDPHGKVTLVFIVPVFIYRSVQNLIDSGCKYLNVNGNVFYKVISVFLLKETNIKVMIYNPCSIMSSFRPSVWWGEKQSLSTLLFAYHNPGIWLYCASKRTNILERKVFDGIGDYQRRNPLP